MVWRMSNFRVGSNTGFDGVIEEAGDGERADVTGHWGDGGEVGISGFYRPWGDKCVKWGDKFGVDRGRVICGWGDKMEKWGDKNYLTCFL